MADRIKFTLDGREVEAGPDETIWQVASREGVDIPLDFGKLEEHGCFVGSHAVVILSDRDDMTEVALNLMKFFEDESCGQCTPCRNGTEKAVQLMSRPRWDADALNDLAIVMRDSSICGLGQAAPNPLASVLMHFPEDVAKRSEPGALMPDDAPEEEPPPGGEERSNV